MYDISCQHIISYLFIYEVRLAALRREGCTFMFLQNKKKAYLIVESKVLTSSEVERKKVIIHVTNKKNNNLLLPSPARFL